MKTKDEILNQAYMTTKDLKQILGFGLTKCQNLMTEIKEEAIVLGYYIPEQRKLVVPTKLVKKKFKL